MHPFLFESFRPILKRIKSWIPETHNDTVQLQFNLTSIQHLYFI